MTALRPRFGEGRALKLSYTPSEVLSGGHVVEPITGTRLVRKAQSGSLKACGVATGDVKATRVAYSDVIVNDELALEVVRGCVIAVTFDDAAAVGDKLKIAATAGQVTPVTADGDPRLIVGEAFEAVAADAVGLALIY